MKDCFIGYGAMNKNGVAECKDGAEPFEKAGTDGICLPKCNQGQVPLSISNVKNGNVVDSTVVVGDRCQ